MMRKLLGLASVSALAGLVSAVGAAGCSDTTGEAGPTDDGGADVTTRPDARRRVGDDEEPPVEKCYEDDPIDVSASPYKPARVQAGACTTAVFDVIQDVLDEGGGQADLNDVKNAISKKESAECAACVFGEDGDTWAPIVLSGDKVVAQNIGGCFEMLSGKASCGKAVQQWNGCLREACWNCKGADAKECAQSAQQTACKDSTADIIEECGQDINAYLRSCFATEYVIGVGGSIQELCVGTGSIEDGGTD